ncbi:Tensin phosphatase [Macleaya cordata]|uniref:Formin-like protein n=1 Tax=Macleaya cordata TaxID=56857 RepID=A0A200QFK3_MACCD|nr:Tensin phosphatase [Macleaya cordata]
MALFRKFFYRKPPDGLLEISERVYVFDCCFSTDVLEEDNYKVYMGGIVGQLREHLPEASFMVFNFREGERQSQIASILSEYDMTVMDYPRHYEGCPLLTMEVIHHFLRSSESWLSLGHQNVLLMHCERGGWPVLAFMLAALLIYRKQYSGELKTLDMIYKQAPRELMQLLSPLDPLPSQLRYLHYVSRRNVGLEWPPLDRALTLDCIILRILPDFDGEGGCRPIFRIYGPDPFIAADRTPKVLFSTPKKSKTVRLYKQADCELVKIDINCHIQGDVVLECISLDEDLEREEMMFRVMFNTAFIRSNILMLNRDEIDILWNAKDRFPKNFRAEVLLSEMDTGASLITVELPSYDEKDGLPMEAFSKVQEIFSSVDWLDPKADVALNVLQKITASNILQEKLDPGALQKKNTDALLPDMSPDKVQEKLKPALLNNIKSSTSMDLDRQPGPSLKPSPESTLTKKTVQPQEVQVGLQRPTQPKIISQRIPHSSLSCPVSESNSLQSSPVTTSRYQSAPSALGITALLHDHASYGSTDVPHPVTAPPSPSPSTPLPKPKGSSIVSVPPAPTLPPAPAPISTMRPLLVAPKSITSSSPPAAAAPPPPPPPPPHHTPASKLGSDQPPPPPPPPLSSPSSKIAASAPPPPPPPSSASKNPSGPTSQISPHPPMPPPPAPFARGVPKVGGASPTSLSVGNNVSSTSVRPPTPAPPLNAPFSAKGRGPHTTSPRNAQSAPSKKTSLKPLHWLKLTRAMQGSLWAEAQRTDEASKAPEFDMSELESLFSAAGPNSDRGSSSDKSNRRASLGSKSDKVQLIDLRRAYNCEIMLTKVKIPLPDLMGSVLALDDSALDVDQVDNLIKFCPTKEEMDLLKGYSGDKENLGKCEQFFLELMKVPRVESKLRVFSFKIQFSSQVSDLRKNLNVVNSAAEEIRNSAKLKRIMQTILSLGNALNQGTARGSAIGFRLDSLLKLIDTRARNNKMTLMHYLCKVLADKLPELLDFQKDLVSLEASSKIQLKYLAEEMQAISKGLEKVEQELTASENDGPVSQTFRKTLKEFLVDAESEVRSLASLYSGVGRSADALALYFGEDPARCPFEQVVSTLVNFVRMFARAHDENCKQLELERKRAQKEAESEKVKVGTPKNVSEQLGHILIKKAQNESESEKMTFGTPKKESQQFGQTLLKKTHNEAESEKMKIGTPRKESELGQTLVKKAQKEAESEKLKIGTTPKKESEQFGQNLIKNRNIK